MSGQLTPASFWAWMLAILALALAAAAVRWLVDADVLRQAGGTAPRWIAHLNAHPKSQADSMPNAGRPRYVTSAQPATP